MRWQRTGTGHGGKEKVAREETVRIWLVRKVQEATCEHVEKEQENCRRKIFGQNTRR